MLELQDLKQTRTKEQPFAKIIKMFKMAHVPNRRGFTRSNQGLTFRDLIIYYEHREGNVHSISSTAASQVLNKLCVMLILERE